MGICYCIRVWALHEIPILTHTHTYTHTLPIRIHIRYLPTYALLTHTHYHTHYYLLHHRYAGTDDGTTVCYLTLPSMGLYRGCGKMGVLGNLTLYGRIWGCVEANIRRKPLWRKDLRRYGGVSRRNSLYTNDLQRLLQNNILYPDWGWLLTTHLI